MRKLVVCFVVMLAATILFPVGARAQTDWTKYEAQATDLLRQYFRIDTSNPPGNEKRAADFFCALFAKEGIECQIFDIAPGRANAYARLKGDGSKRPLILLNHMDVVIADPKLWTVPPFSAEVRNGAIYGRGAQDMKSEGMLQAMVMIALKREKVALSRDVIFLGVADEELGTLGTEWMLKNKRELVADAEFLINEGGENLLEENGALPFWGVDVAEKAPFWLRLTAHGKAGHGSVPRADSAPNRLARALARVVDYETPLKVTPLSQQTLCDIARVEFPTEKERFCNLETSLRDPAFRKRVSENPDWAFMLRNTISLTVLKGGPQTNVIPAEAFAELDIRLLPGEEPQKILEEIKRVVADDTITVESIATVRKPNESPVDTALWSTFTEVVGKYFPNTIVSPRLTSGYTENQIYRQLGIHSYGFCPFVSTREESETPHGTDERILVNEYQAGLRVLFDVVTREAGK
jgi:acetylornithine deacetylase/succinyl-diaminopimelate desuccinylase-like protein